MSIDNARPLSLNAVGVACIAAVSVAFAVLAILNRKARKETHWVTMVSARSSSPSYQHEFGNGDRRTTGQNRWSSGRLFGEGSLRQGKGKGGAAVQL